ncbi:MAG: RluA family pseudouridine synthase [Alphaproteobacteria bacterium]|nr:RluA family pseudouridine synthase [Alphaproteobacteria bacterium]
MNNNTYDDFLVDDTTDNKKTPLLSPIVSSQDKGTRLDKFLSAAFSDLSRNQIIRLINEENIYRIDENIPVTEPDYKVKEGEQYTLTPPNAIPAIPQAENIALDILYEDDDLLVVNKPAGLVVHPGAGNHSGTLVNALLAHCHETLSGIGGVKRPGIVHRIDKDTSGILVVAKNDFTHIRLSEQFEHHSIERVYDAFVWGYVRNLTGVITGNIGRSPTNRQKMAIVKTGGKHATTHYERISVFGQGLASHIKCILETGRTHQIRVHMASLGHSLIGDQIYGIPNKNTPEEIKYFPRQALHAGLLGFTHPRTQERMTFETPIPEDMEQLLTLLEEL